MVVPKPFMNVTYSSDPPDYNTKMDTDEDVISNSSDMLVDGLAQQVNLNPNNNP